MTSIQVENRMDTLLASARKDYAAIMTSLESYQQRMTDATAAMDEAIAASDLEAYSVATAKQSDAQRALDLYGKRKDALEASPLMPEDDVKELHEAIVTNFSDVQSKIENRLREIADELDQMRTTLEDSVDESNRLLHKLQFDVARGTGLRYGKDGRLAWDSGKWTVSPLHGRHESIFGLLQKLTPETVKKALG